MPNITSAWMDKAQKPGLHWDARHHGLGVRVWNDGRTKSWIFQKSGRDRRTLGRWPSIEINEARRLAAEANERGAPKKRTVRDVHDTWARDHLLRGGSPVTVKEAEGRVGKHAHHIWSVNVASLDKVALLDLRASIMDKSGVHPARDTVNHIRRLVEIATDRRVRLPELRRPRSGRGEQSANIEEWWPCILQSTSTQMYDAHCVAALTGLRQSDILQIRKSNIEGDRVFIPSPKTKMGQDLSFWRHLPAQVASILARQWSHETDLAFPFNSIRAGKGSYSHRLRHHFIGLAESETAVPRRVLRKLVNHTGKSDVTDGYGHVTDESCARWSQEIADLISAKIKL
ncbi:MAG: integrase family protein [Pseudomonadota bacterium]